MHVHCPDEKLTLAQRNHSAVQSTTLHLDEVALPSTLPRCVSIPQSTSGVTRGRGRYGCLVRDIIAVAGFRCGKYRLHLFDVFPKQCFLPALLLRRSSLWTDRSRSDEKKKLACLGGFCLFRPDMFPISGLDAALAG